MKGTLEKNITLDLERTGVQARITVRQGDSLVHKIKVRLTCGGKRYSPRAVLAQFYALLPDGSTASADGKLLSDGTVEFIPGGGFFKFGGPVLFRMVLRGDDGGELYSPAFAVDADPTFGSDSPLIPAEEYSRLEEMFLRTLALRNDCAVLAEEMRDGAFRTPLSDAMPLSGTEASAGRSDTAARADHVHPLFVEDGSITPEKTSFITEEETGEGATSEFIPRFTNLADPDSEDWLVGYTLGGDKNQQIIETGDNYKQAVVTNHIPCKAGDIIRIKGLNVDLDYDLGGAVALKYLAYKPDGGFVAAAKYLLRSHISGVTGNTSTGVYEILDKDELAKGIVCVKIGQKGDGSMGSGTYASLRVTGMPVDENGNPTFDTSNVIITINQPIEYDEIISGGDTEPTLDPDIVVPLARENRKRLDTHDVMLSNVGADAPEIIMPYELAVAVGVECNIFKENIVFSSRALDNYSIWAKLTDENGNKVEGLVQNYPDFFRITAEEEQEGDYTFTVELRDRLTNAVILAKSAVMHIVADTDYTSSPKNVLFIGDSVTASYRGTMMAEIQYNLSGGGIVSVGTQTGTANDYGYAGSVKHEGYNGATVYSTLGDGNYIGFIKENIKKDIPNPFWNPATQSFDLGYYMAENNITQIDAICVNLGLNSITAHSYAKTGLMELVTKIREYDPEIPIIISMCTQLATGPEARTDVVANRINWKNLQEKSVLGQFDNGVMHNVYISTPYMALDMNKYYETVDEPRSARDTEIIKRVDDYYHPVQIGVQMLSDAYYPWILYALGNS